MTKIKHLSADLWLTLIKSNPKSKENIQKFWHNELGWSKYAVEIVLKECNNYFTRLDEITGIHSSLIYRFHYLYSMAGFDTNKEFLEEKVSVIYPKLEEMFLEYPPLLYGEYTKPTLEILKDKGITTNILSNTGIIQGDTLTKALELLDIDNLFNFSLYSDKLNISKPDESIFLEIYSGSLDTQIQDAEDVLHIGDNLIADGGCTKIGMQFLHINSNSNNTIQKVLDYV